MFSLKNKKLDLALKIFIVMLAASISAVGNKLFLLPHKITPGGFAGFATILHQTILPKVPVGVITLILNVPLYLAALKIIGNTFGILSVVGTVTYSVIVDVIPAINIGAEPILSCVYGGAIMGIGFGIILRIGGSTGGSDMLSYVINHYRPNISVGTMMLLVDGAVILLSGIIFGINTALYAFITIFLSSKVVDQIMDGGKMSKAYYIISKKSEEIALAVLEKMGRGVTALKGQGMYTKRDKDVLLCIVLRAQGSQLKNIVFDIDETAFIFAANIQEVYGEGFYKLRKKDFALKILKNKPNEEIGNQDSEKAIQTEKIK